MRSEPRLPRSGPPSRSAPLDVPPALMASWTLFRAWDSFKQQKHGKDFPYTCAGSREVMIPSLFLRYSTLLRCMCDAQYKSSAQFSQYASHIDISHTRPVMHVPQTAPTRCHTVIGTECHFCYPPDVPPSLAKKIMDPSTTGSAVLPAGWG